MSNNVQKSLEGVIYNLKSQIRDLENERMMFMSQYEYRIDPELYHRHLELIACRMYQLIKELEQLQNQTALIRNVHYSSLKITYEEVHSKYPV